MCIRDSLLSEGIIDEIMRGGSDVMRSVGVPILGGHSVDDDEPKYGLVAIGEVDPARMVTNSSARAGDALVLTKPIGSGVIATAIKNVQAPENVVAIAVDSMTTLNADAASVMVSNGITAATDVTGFGLLGHLRSLMRASNVSATLQADKVPMLLGARKLAEAGHIPDGSKRNLDDLASDVSFETSVDEVTKILLADAQTSGGLLMSVPAERLENVTNGLAETASTVAVIGRVAQGLAGTIKVI